MAGTSASGRRAKSIDQHKLEGTYQKCRHEGRITPKAPLSVPNPPGPLDETAQAEWTRMVARMRDLGTLSHVDDAALYQYCRLWSETDAIAVTKLETAATIDLLEENLTGPKEERESLLEVVQEIGKLKQLESRYTNQIRQGRMAIRQYLVEFGMTPSARTRVRVPETKDEDPFAEFEGAVQ